MSVHMCPWAFSKLALCMCVCAKLLQPCLLCNPVDCSPPGSSAHGVLQASMLEWAAMPPTEGFLTRGLNLCSCGSCIAGIFFSPEPLGKPQLDKQGSHFNQ